ncbi:MAG: AgmX/PglI C-terminal domain-containing protein [Bdellovibrionota bacterium]
MRIFPIAALFFCFTFTADAAEIKADSGLVVMGGISREAVQSTLDRRGSFFRACYSQIFGETKKHPHGEIRVRFGINGVGHVTVAAVTSSSFKNEKLETCVESVFRRTVFPQVEGGGIVEADYLLHFPLPKAGIQP